jgi:hypothetical protein
VWLLDLDGVVNALADEPPTKVWPAAAWIEVEVEGAHGLHWPIRAARPVVDFIWLVHETGRAEVRWHSTWQQHANAVGRALGLPEFPVHRAPEFDEPEEKWWKLPGARRVLGEEGRGLLWTDDDTGAEMSRAERAGLKSLGPLLIVCPDTMTGLNHRQLRRIDAFLGEFV